MLDWILSSIKETLTSPLDLFLLGVLAFIVWKYFLSKKKDEFPPPEPQLPPMTKQDMTLEDLRKYDGSSDDGRLLVAVDGRIFDVTRAKRLYGKAGPYGLFAGRDASRGLGTFSADANAVRDDYDDLSDLSASEIESMKEWAQQFSEKYPVVGRLIKPGEPAHKYESEVEEEHSSSSETPRDRDKSAEK